MMNNDFGNYCAITEQGDLGLGAELLNDKDQLNLSRNEKNILGAQNLGVAVNNDWSMQQLTGRTHYGLSDNCIPSSPYSIEQ